MPGNATQRSFRKGPPIRVMHFLNSPEVSGGVEEHVFSLLESLPAERFEVSLVSPSISHKMFARLAAPHRHIFCLDLYRLSQVRAMGHLVRILRAQKIQIAHSHQFCATLFLAPLAKACGVPWVIETNHVREAWRRSWWKRSYIVDRAIYMLVDRFIAVSRANQAHLTGPKHCDPSKVVQIYNGRDLRRFQPNGMSGQAIRQQYGIAPSDLLLVHVGRLEPQKGHSVLIEALPRVRERIPQIRILFVGEGSLRDSLEKEVQQRALAKAVSFTGFQASVEAFLNAADLVVLPSLWEGLPLTAVEASAVGKALVATAVDGTSEVVRNGQTGLLVPPNDSLRLAEAIIALLSDEPRRKQMGAGARRRAWKQFSLEQQVEKTAALYESLVHAHSAARKPASAHDSEQVAHGSAFDATSAQSGGATG